jgi:hypothetical protein
MIRHLMPNFKSSLVFITVLIFSLITGCNDNNSKRLVKIENELNTVKNMVDKQALTILGLNGKLLYQEFRIKNLSESVFGEKSIILDPSEKGFSVLETNTGFFLVSFGNATPYLDGHKIQLNIGNPFQMDFNGIVSKVTYGRREPDFPDSEKLSNEEYTKATNKWNKDYEVWKQSLREKEISLLNTLLPGMWNKIEITLPSTKPEEIGYLKLSIRANQVSLNSLRGK